MDSREQTAGFVPVRIEPGHCLAGYVASSKESVRIENISVVNASLISYGKLLILFLRLKLDKSKYPDGLYLKADKVTAVMAHPIINARGTLLGKTLLPKSTCHRSHLFLTGVVEFYRTGNATPFSIEDEEVCIRSRH